jgi:hypothetical protein
VTREKGDPLASNPVAGGGEEAFERQRLHAFHDHAADHLDRRGSAHIRPGDARAHGERGKQRRDRLGMRAGKKERRLMPRRIDRRNDRDIDIARAVGEKLFGLCLRAGETELMSRK